MKELSVLCCAVPFAFLCLCQGLRPLPRPRPLALALQPPLARLDNARLLPPLCQSALARGDRDGRRRAPRRGRRTSAPVLLLVDGGRCSRRTSAHISHESRSRAGPAPQGRYGSLLRSRDSSHIRAVRRDECLRTRRRRTMVDASAAAAALASGRCRAIVYILYT